MGKPIELGDGVRPVPLPLSKWSYRGLGTNILSDHVRVLREAFGRGSAMLLFSSTLGKPSSPTRRRAATGGAVAFSTWIRRAPPSIRLLLRNLWNELEHFADSGVCFSHDLSLLHFGAAHHRSCFAAASAAQFALDAATS